MKWQKVRKKLVAFIYWKIILFHDFLKTYSIIHIPYNIHDINNQYIFYVLLLVFSTSVHRKGLKAKMCY